MTMYYALYEESGHSKKWLQIQSPEEITIVGYEKWTFVIHQTKSGWRITEVISGRCLSGPHPTRDDVINEATMLMDIQGEKGLVEQIRKSVNKYGIAPSCLSQVLPVSENEEKTQRKEHRISSDNPFGFIQIGE